MPEPFDRLKWPTGLSSVEILWVWLGVRIEREKVEMSQSASEWGRAGPLGLVSVVFSLALFDMSWPRALCGPAFKPQSVEAHIE